MPRAEESRHFPVTHGILRCRSATSLKGPSPFRGMTRLGILALSLARERVPNAVRRVRATDGRLWQVAPARHGFAVPPSPASGGGQGSGKSPPPTTAFGGGPPCIVSCKPSLIGRFAGRCHQNRLASSATGSTSAVLPPASGGGQGVAPIKSQRVLASNGTIPPVFAGRAARTILFDTPFSG